MKRLSPSNLLIISIANLSGFLFGYHTAVISGALIFLAPALGLSVAEQGIVVSTILLGAILGALIGGSLSDRFGRKKTLILTAFLFTLGSLVISIADDYAYLLSGRGISGVGLGIASVVCPLYLAETSSSKYRGGIVSSYQLAITIGILVAFGVNYALASTGKWRLMFALGGIPALMQIGALFFIPETPTWLVRKGRNEQAKVAFARVRKGEKWGAYLTELEKSPGAHRLGKWKDLFRGKGGWLVCLGLMLSVFQQITGVNTVIYYAPQIFQSAGFASAQGAIFATLGIGIINVIATLFSVWLIDRIGRRKLLLIGVGAMALSLAVLSVAFWINLPRIDLIAVTSLMAYISFFAIGLGPVTWVLLSEIFPLKIRAKAMTVAIFANWFSNYIVSLTFLNLTQWIHPSGCFALYGILCVFSFLFIYRLIPETKGKSLEEIEERLLK